MKLRHAAALPLMGWALIFPSMVGDRVDSGAPVREWEVMGKSYPTIKDCEKDRPNVGWFGYANLSEAAGNSKEPGRMKAFPARRAASRCLPDDDPRLKSK
jgi:hypothetical protein